MAAQVETDPHCGACCSCARIQCVLRDLRYDGIRRRRICAVWVHLLRAGAASRNNAVARRTAQLERHHTCDKPRPYPHRSWHRAAIRWRGFDATIPSASRNWDRMCPSRDGERPNQNCEDSMERLKVILGPTAPVITFLVVWLA